MAKMQVLYGHMVARMFVLRDAVCVLYTGQCGGAVCTGDNIIILCAHAHAVCM